MEEEIGVPVQQVQVLGTLPPLEYRAACLQYRGHTIWGATAKIVGDFLEQAADLFPEAAASTPRNHR